MASGNSSQSWPGTGRSSEVRMTRLRGTANMEGPSYEFKLSGLAALRAYRGGLRFQILTNVAVARPLDDVLIRVWETGEHEAPSVTFFLQLKHSANKKMLNDDAFTTSKGDFSLPKYFECYERLMRITDKPEEQLTEEERWLKESLRNFRLVLYTTKATSFALSPLGGTWEEHVARTLLPTGTEAESGKFSYKNKKVWNFYNDIQQMYQDTFLKNLTIFSKSTCDYISEDFLCEMNALMEGNLESVCDPFINFIKNCIEDNSNGYYFTPSCIEVFLKEVASGEERDTSGERATGAQWRALALLALRACRRGLSFKALGAKACAHLPESAVMVVVRLSADNSVTYILQPSSSFPAKEEFSCPESEFFLPKYFEALSSGEQQGKKKKKKQQEVRLVVCLPSPSPPSASGSGREEEEEDYLLPWTEEGISFTQKDKEIWNIFEKKIQLYQDTFLKNLILLARQERSKRMGDYIIKEISVENDKLYYGDSERFKNSYLDFFTIWAEDVERDYAIQRSHIEQFLNEELSRELRKGSPRGNGKELLQFEEEALDAVRSRIRSRVEAKCSLRVVVPEASAPGRRSAKLIQALESDWKDQWVYVDAGALHRYPLEAIAAAGRCGRILLTDVERAEEVAAHRLVEETGSCVVHVALRAAAPGTCAQEEFEDKWCVDQLVDVCREDLLQRCVTFQGKDVRLEELLKTWPSLHDDVGAETILCLEANNKPHIGDFLPQTAEEWGRAALVGRRLEHHREVTKEALRACAAGDIFLALRGFPQELLDKAFAVSQHNARWMSLEPAQEVDRKQLLSLAKRENASSIHVLEYISGDTLQDVCMLWKTSVGDAEMMRAFLKDCKKENKCALEPLCVHEAFCPLLMELPAALLVGEPGVGKTIEMEVISCDLKERCPTTWVVVIKILEHIERLRSWEESVPALREEHAVELLAMAAGAEDGAARRCLEAAVSCKGAVSVFVDGVDEVASAFKDQALSLLQLLRGLKGVSRLWTATRPEVEESLRPVLRCPRLKLQPLNQDEQDKFLIDFLAKKEKGKEKKHEKEAIGILRMIRMATIKYNNGETDVLGVPLHLVMVAEVLSQKDPDIYKMASEERFSLMKLYRFFIRKKENIYAKKHKLVLENLPFDIGLFNDQFSAFILFGDMPSFEDLLTELKRFIDKNEKIVKLGKEKTGLMWMDGNGKLHFVHQTFCEFLAARWLFRKCTIGDEQSEHARRFVLNEFSARRTWWSKKSRVQEFLEEMLLEEFPLHAAAWSGDWEAIELLLGSGSDCWEQRDTLLHKKVPEYLEWIHGRTWQSNALSSAAYNGYKWFARVLLKHHAAALTPRDLSFALHEAATREKKGVSDALLDSGATDSPFGWEEQTALHKAAKRGDVATLQALLQRSGLRFLNAVDWEGRTPLHLSISDNKFLHRHEAVQTLLRQEGIDVGVADKKGFTPLALATEVECKLCMDSVLRLGADVDGGGDKCPVITATTKNDTSSLRFLLEKGASANARGPNGSTALHVTAQKGQVAAMAELLKHGACVNALAARGRSPLHYAAIGGSEEAARLLLDNEANPALRDSEGCWALDEALSTNNEGLIKLLVQAVKGVEAWQKEALRSAAFRGCEWFVRELLQHHATALIPEDLSFALYQAAEKGRKGIVDALLDVGATDTPLGLKGRTALHAAAGNGDLATLETLLQRRGLRFLNAVDWEGRTPLHLAISDNKLLHRHEAVETLLRQEGIEVGVADEKGFTPLALATEVECKLCMESVLRLGADVDGGGDKCPLIIAATKNDTSALRFLVQEKANVAATDGHGQTAMHLLAKDGNAETLELLISHGASVDGKDQNGVTPFHWAAYEGNVEALKLLINHGEFANEKDQNGVTPLHCAAGEGNVEALKLLINHGASADEKDENDATILHWAARSGNVEAIKIIINHGGYSDDKDRNGMTPFYWAACQGNVEALILLINHGASWVEKDQNESTPIHRVVYEANVGATKFPIHHGASADEKDQNGVTPFHWAAYEGNVEALKLLIKHGASCDEKDQNGMTPLHWAARGGNLEAIVFIMNHGGSAYEKDQNGETPLHWAARGGNVEAITFLINHGVFADEND